MTIINTKNIATSGFDADALSTITPGEDIINFGQLWTSGDLANGIFAGANNVSIINNGHVETSGLGAAGIYVEGSDAHINNYGTVVTHGGFYDPNPKIDGDEFYSEGIFAHGDGFYIANHGSVQVSGLFSSALVGVGDDGVVINFNVVDSSAIGSSAIAVFGKSQAINATSGEVTIYEVDTTALLAVGDGASALNLGQIKINGTQSTGIEGVDGSTQITNNGVISITADASVGMLGLADGNQITNFGLMEAKGTFSSAIITRGFNVEIINAGHIATEGERSFGITLGLTRAGFGPAGGGQIVNSGVIETKGDGAAGVVMAGNLHHLVNSGQITTDGGGFDAGFAFFHAAGVVVSGDDALVENSESGVIESKNAASAAVELNILKRNGLTNSKTSSDLENYGLVKGATVAVLGSAGEEAVINHGQITGDVVLGSGADTFVFASGGRLSGMLFLGGGDDLVRIEKGSGSMTIADFAAGPAGKDIIDISAFYDSFADLKAHAHQSGNDVAIGLGHHDQLMLANVKLGALDSGDFIFNPTT